MHIKDYPVNHHFPQPLTTKHFVFLVANGFAILDISDKWYIIVKKKKVSCPSWENTVPTESKYLHYIRNWLTKVFNSLHMRRCSLHGFSWTTIDTIAVSVCWNDDLSMFLSIGQHETKKRNVLKLTLAHFLQFLGSLWWGYPGLWNFKQKET